MTSVLKVDNIQNSSGTSALTIDSSGNLTATQGFVTGTFTPTVLGTTVAGVFVYDTSNTYGHYQRIGDYVFINGRVVVSSVTTSATGNAQIGGLPFTSSEAAAITQGYTDWGGTGWGAYGTFLHLNSGSTTINIYYWSSDDMINSGAGIWDNTTDITFSGFYRTL